MEIFEEWLSTFNKLDMKMLSTFLYFMWKRQRPEMKVVAIAELVGKSLGLHERTVHVPFTSVRYMY